MSVIASYARRWRKLVPLALLAALVFVPSGTATAGCAGPEIRVPGEAARPTLAPGTTVVVEGEYFTEGCNDEGGGSGCHSNVEEIVPIDNLTLTIHQGGRRWDLATEDAGNADGLLGEVHWQVRIPADVEIGAAVLTAGDDGARLRVLITR